MSNDINSTPPLRAVVDIDQLRGVRSYDFKLLSGYLRKLAITLKEHEPERLADSHRVSSLASWFQTFSNAIEGYADANLCTSYRHGYHYHNGSGPQVISTAETYANDLLNKTNELGECLGLITPDLIRNLVYKPPLSENHISKNDVSHPDDYVDTPHYGKTVYSIQSPYVDESWIKSPLSFDDLRQLMSMSAELFSKLGISGPTTHSCLIKSLSDAQFWRQAYDPSIAH